MAVVELHCSNILNVCLFLISTNFRYFIQNILNLNMDSPYASPFVLIKSSVTFILDHE